MSYYKEILTVEAIVFIILWVSNEYIATLLTMIAIPIFGAILIISLIAETLEKSKISKEYFYLMAGLTLIPSIIMIAAYFTNGGTSFDWTKQ